MKVYGFLPPVPESEIPDRHLGLVTAAEIGDIQAKLDRLADAAEECLDLDGLLKLAIPHRRSQTNSIPSCQLRTHPFALVLRKTVHSASIIRTIWTCSPLWVQN